MLLNFGNVTFYKVGDILCDWLSFNQLYSKKKTYETRASLVAQWLRIHLPMQGTRVPALVWEDPTCRGATKPMRQNFWACALEPASHNYWARVPQLLKPTRLEPVLRNKGNHGNGSPRTTTKSSPCSPQLKPTHRNKVPMQPKINFKNK